MLTCMIKLGFLNHLGINDFLYFSLCKGYLTKKLGFLTDQMQI